MPGDELLPKSQVCLIPIYSGQHRCSDDYRKERTNYYVIGASVNVSLTDWLHSPPYKREVWAKPKTELKKMRE